MKPVKNDLSKLHVFFFLDFCISFQMDQFQLNIATGCTVYLAMKHLAQDIGHVGMEHLPNNYASVVCYTTKMLIVVTGLKMSKDAKNIVSIFQ